MLVLVAGAYAWAPEPRSAPRLAPLRLGPFNANDEPWKGGARDGDGDGDGDGGDGDGDGGDGGDGGARPTFCPDPALGADDAIARLDNFLTQRAAQTLMHYYALGRDMVRRDWLENWEGHRGLRRFHGHGGLRVPAAEYARGLLVAPPEEVTIALKKRGAGHGGWSKNNP